MHPPTPHSEQSQATYAYTPGPKSLIQAGNERAAVRSGLGVLQLVIVRAVPRYVITITYFHFLPLRFTVLSFLSKILATGEQSCARGFQSWDTVNATFRTPRNRTYIFPSLNFSCAGVIRGWALKRFEGIFRNRSNTGRVLVGEMIALQLWREKAGTASIYTLQTEQTHTARTSNAPSYAFTASSPMTVAAGDVFGFYIPRGTGPGGGLRVAAATLSSHTVFISQTAPPPTEFTVTNTGAHRFPLVSIEFSKSLQHKMITC